MKPVEMKANVRILDCTLCPKGKTELSFFAQPDNSITAQFHLTDGSELKLSEVESIEELEIQAGWNSPREILKTGGLAILFFVGGDLLAEIIEGTEFTPAVVDNMELEVFLGGLVRIMTISGVSGYVATSLSTRRMRMGILMRDGKHLRMEVPEFAGMLLWGMWQKQNGGDRE